MIVKVCGMREAENIRQVEQTGADWMGFIDYEGSPRYVADVPNTCRRRCRKWECLSMLPSRKSGKEWRHGNWISFSSTERNRRSFAGKCNRPAYASSRPSPCVRLTTCWQRKAMPPAATIFCSTLPATDTEAPAKASTGKC